MDPLSLLHQWENFKLFGRMYLVILESLSFFGPGYLRREFLEPLNPATVLARGSQAALGGP